MDTVEWGNGGRADEERVRSPRVALDAVLPRPTAAILAVLAFAALLGAVVLPWTSLQVPTSTTGGAEATAQGIDIGLERLNTIGTLTYQLGWVLLLGLVGLAILGRETTRRAAIGAAFGVAGGLLMVVISMIRSFRYVVSGDGVGGTGAGPQTSMGAGAYLAFAALALAVAAVAAAAWLPVRSRRAQPEAADPEVWPGEGEEGTAGPPVDMTVSPLPPLDERYFARPEGR